MQYQLPAGFSLRRPTMDDIPAIVAMVQDKERIEDGSVSTTEDGLRINWAPSPTRDISKDNWLFLASDGRIAAVLSVGRWNPTRLASNLAAHPAYASQGLYPPAIELALERARELVPEAPAHARVTLNFWCSEKDAEGLQALEQAGFIHVRSNWTMLIEMDTPPSLPVWPEHIELRPFTADMLRVVFEADDEAFSDHWGHVPGNFEVWENWLINRPNFDPSLWFIAYDGEKIAGVALCLKIGEEAWVDDLAVRRPWRRRGLGLALLQHSFGEFYRRGERKVVLNVDTQNTTGATRLYTRAGMRAVEQRNTFQMELRSGMELGVE